MAFRFKEAEIKPGTDDFRIKKVVFSWSRNVNEGIQFMWNNGRPVITIVS